MWIEGAPFVYRHNPDRTIDAICTTCLATICSVTTLPAVKKAEAAHRCPGLDPFLTQGLLPEPGKNGPPD
jgi:hypothetical protein